MIGADGIARYKARPAGFEPATYGFEVRCAIHCATGGWANYTLSAGMSPELAGAHLVAGAPSFPAGTTQAQRLLDPVLDGKVGAVVETYQNVSAS